MSMLVLGLYAEGPTDYDFLPPVIQKTAEWILAQHDQSGMDALVLIIALTEDQKKARDASILQAACNAFGYHALIVHSDADDPKPEKARVERFDPGYELVQHSSEQVCKHLLPIIPVQTIEAWIMADYELLLKEIGTDMSHHDLDIPEKAKLVELISKPKQRLEEIVRKAYAGRPRRQRETDIDFLYEPMGEKINLERLKQVPAYQRFVQDLTNTLKALNFIA